MAEKFLKQLGKWVKKQESAPHDKNLVMFLAVRDDVKAAVHEGYTIKTIWAALCNAKRIDFCYETFRTYVNRLIRGPAENQAAPPKDAKDQPDTNKTGPKIIKPAPAPGFTFNPNPNKEDLF